MTERHTREAIERETQRDEIRLDPEVSPMVKRVMEKFWRRVDQIDGLHPAVSADGERAPKKEKPPDGWLEDGSWQP